VHTNGLTSRQQHPITHAYELVAHAQAGSTNVDDHCAHLDLVVQQRRHQELGLGVDSRKAV